MVFSVYSKFHRTLCKQALRLDVYGLITSIATAAKQPSSKPQGFDERSSYLGIAYF